MKLINYRELSRLLTGKTTNIRANNIPEKYKDRIKELEVLLEFWINKHSIKK